MACSCDSCSSPRIIKTRTALYWRWVAQSRGETADRVILAPARARVSVGVGHTEPEMPIESAEASSEAREDASDADALDRRREEFLRIVGQSPT
jgi:hypothetical protein